MAQQVRPQVRPTLLIFVGKTGEQIREYLSPYYDGQQQRRLQDPPTPSTYHLLASLDDSVRDSVALLQVVTEGKQADASKAIAFPVMKEFPHDKDMATGQGPLESMIQRALFSVQLARRIDRIRQAGYEVPNPRTQVLIVGEPNKINTPWFARILEIVRQYAQSLNFEVPICYVLNCYDLGNDFSQSLKKSLGSPGLKWVNYETANFSYLYEPIIPYPAPLTVMPESVRYATAETLLAFAATGITSLRFIEDGVLLDAHKPDLEDYSPYIGSLSTSMIRFPRPSVVHYCTTHLASELIQKWRHDLNASCITPEQRDRARSDGITIVDRLEAWIAPSEPRPLAEEKQWPSFEILRQANLPGVKQQASQQKDAYEQLLHETEKLFGLFSHQDILEDYRCRQERTQTWAEFTYERFNRASSTYEHWERTAQQSWHIMQATIDDHMRYEIDRRWSAGSNGFALTRVFVNQLDEGLADLTTRVSQWRHEHSLDYKEQQNRAAKMADRRWHIPDNRQSLQGTGPSAQSSAGQARPTMSHIAIQGNTGASITTGTGGRPPGLAVPQHLPPAEDSIARCLYSRAVWKQNQVPSIGALCSVGLLGLITAVFSASASGLSSTLLVTASAALAAVITAGNIGFHLARKKEYVAAQKDISEFYSNYYHSKCTHREDLQRISLIRTLAHRVMRMRQRIEHMEAFFDERARTALDDAQEACHSLFEGPAATRDVFIADGERLQARGTHTLESIASKIGQMRKNHPLADWQRTLDMIKDHLAKDLQQNSRSLLDMNADQFQEYLYQFTQPIIEGYLTGPLVDISEALDKPGVWRDVLEQARRPLYTADIGVRDPYQLFVCGSSQALAKGTQHIPSNALQLLTKGNEWLLIVGLFRGGRPRAIDADMLFPVKKSPPHP
jgi:hypothetical protein